MGLPAQIDRYLFESQLALLVHMGDRSRADSIHQGAKNFAAAGQERASGGGKQGGKIQHAKN